MHGHGKSDRSVVPEKSPNKASGAPHVAEGMEERDLAKGNPRQFTRCRTQSRVDLQQALERVRQAARKDRGLRLTTLWHHVYDPTRLREAYFSLKRKAAPGVDGVTWQQYGEDLEANLEDLSGRLQRGAYRAKPVKRAYIAKGDGRMRPIGMPTLEDKLVQRAAAEVMGAVFETDFKGFSYGFRPKRQAHDALDALTVGIKKRRVNWILDADILGYFDAIDHGWMMKFVEHRIADQRVQRHVKKWLKAGVLEDGTRRWVEEGTPQGGSISPLLANIYLHHVFDLWAEAWRKRRARGDMILVRYADDFVVGFEHRAEAERFLEELRERFRCFNLELHPDKTRLIEFGRLAAKNRQRRGEGKPATFDFLGFTHMCAKSRDGWFQVRRQPMRKRLRNKLKSLTRELRYRMHDPVPETGKWLSDVLNGMYRYYAIPYSTPTLESFRNQLKQRWRAALRRRSNKTCMTWERTKRLASRWLPHPRVLHPWPEQRLCVKT
jgi:RNA-directed DNA polymerase